MTKIDMVILTMKETPKICMLKKQEIGKTHGLDLMICNKYSALFPNKFTCGYMFVTNIKTSSKTDYLETFFKLEDYLQKSHQK